VVLSGRVEHGRAQAVLARGRLRLLVAGVEMPDDAHAGSVVNTRSRRSAAGSVPSRRDHAAWIELPMPTRTVMDADHVAPLRR